ncbi:probable purine permease 11 [Tanacetum coccineum]
MGKSRRCVGNCVKRALILPLLSSYSCLLEAVSKRLEINANSDFMVTYNSDNDIVEVCDDLEVNAFMDFVVKSSRIVTLCIVESSVNDIEYHATQIHQIQIPVFSGSGGFYQNLPSYQQMHGFSGNPMYVPRFPKYPMQDHQSDSANRKLNSVFGKVKRLSGEDESSESDEDTETTPVENKNFKEDKFWNMPPLLKTSVLDIKKKGTPEESFVELPLYCHNLKLKNQGTITHIETDDEDRFEIFFLAVGAVIRTFVLHMRPLIIIDGAHLKGEFFGIMYLAVAMDGNNQILPLAYGVGNAANKLDMIGLEKWARVHFPDEHRHELTPWTEAKLAQRIAKSTTWTVRPAANYLYNVVDYYKNATVDLNTRTCSLFGGLHTTRLYMTSVWRASEWDQPDGLITVLPPVMDKRQPGRPHNCYRFRSKGEQITLKSCTRCFKGGHNHRDCPSVVPS